MIKKAVLVGRDDHLSALWCAGYVYVSQYPIGRNNRSTVATYTGLMKHVQAIFAKQSQAKEYKGKEIDAIEFDIKRTDR